MISASFQIAGQIAQAFVGALIIAGAFLTLVMLVILTPVWIWGR
jgi:hypothetical protein